MNKHFLLLILFSVMGIAVSAQERMEQYIGLQFGYTMPILRTNDPTNLDIKTLDVEKYSGLKLGVTYDATLVKGFGFNMALNYTYGASATDWTQQYGFAKYVRTRSSYHQVEVAVDWQYKFEIAKSTYLILYSGPTIQCGISMLDKNYVKIGDAEQIQSETQYYKDAYPYAPLQYDMTHQRINVTWGVGAGFQYGRYFLRGGYDFGLLVPFRVQGWDIDGDGSINAYARGRFDQWAIKIGAYLWEL